MRLQPYTESSRVRYEPINQLTNT